jgi:hypothetical protein
MQRRDSAVRSYKGCPLSRLAARYRRSWEKFKDKLKTGHDLLLFTLRSSWEDKNGLI